jgi:tetratricopeptide (TPR) repeat protein
VSEPEAKKRRFAAFISYAHADGAVAAKLQSKLERYRLPKNIAAGRGSGSAALGQIFRDREDLAAAPSLSDAIREAISEAEALVIICSPDAKASRWVGEEIALFRALHPDRPILAALVRGGPEDAFPAALTENGNEPLAADLRPQGDGEALGFLKIVAGIAGVPLDALIQRDAQRRVARVTAITVGALAAMLIMGIMTAFAIQSRNEAARQRAEAEGLVEYMLTDLRSKLEGVGRLDVQDTVNQRAMKYYAAQGDLANLPPESIERRARVLHAMGEDYEKTGDFDKALSKFREAHRATAAVLDKQPNDLKALFAHGQSEYWLGHPAELRHDWQDAMRQYRAYAAIARRLVAAEPQNPEFMMEMGWGHLNVGIVELKSGNAQDFGQASFSLAIGEMKKALQAKPADVSIRNELGNAYAWLADSYYLRGLIDQSLVNRRLEMAQKAHIFQADRRNNAARFEYAKSQYAVANNLIKLGRRSEAVPLLTASSASMRLLRATDAKNQEWLTIDQKITAAMGKGR